MQRAPTPADLMIHLQDYLQNVRATPATAVPPHITIRSIQLQQHHRLQVVYQVNLSDHTSMLVVMPPPPMARLLRSEKNMIKSEATVIHWIREEASRSLFPLKRATTPLGSTSPEETERFMDGVILKYPFARLADHPAARTIPNLLRYLPSPVQRSLSVSLPNSLTPSSILEFNVMAPPPGTPISMLPTPLTEEERDRVDYEAGTLVHQLSRLSSQAGYFGPALAVLGRQYPEGKAAYNHEDSTAQGMTSWSVAFHSLLESILRDGEDMAVALAYSTIRKQFRRFGCLLDTVRIPSLVVVDAMDDSNLLVQRLPAEAPTEDEQGVQTTAAEHGNSSSDVSIASEKQSGGRGRGCRSPSLDALGSMTNPSTRFGPGPEPGSGTQITVTGLRDWSHCVFGDPLFASIFHEEPSEPFLRGFGCERKDVSMTSLEVTSENKNVRLLLYRCYHAVVQIVKGFYRLDDDHTAQELAARKQLTETLSLLEAIGDNAILKSGHCRPTGELSLAKKPRSDSGEKVPARLVAAKSPAGPS